jgi:hypothetical protein
VRFFRYRGIGAGGGGWGRVGSAGLGAVSVLSECVVLCALKQDNEQLYAMSIVSVSEVTNGVVLWKRASRALVLLGLCVTDAAEDFCHHLLNNWGCPLSRLRGKEKDACCRNVCAEC